MSQEWGSYLIVLIAVIVVAACTPSTGEATVEIIPGPQERRLVNEEKITQDNCDGTAVTSDTVERTRTVFRSVVVGTEFSVSADGEVGVPGVGDVGVGAEIANYYEITYGTQDSVTRSVMVGADRGTSMQHTIQHFEIWETGEVVVRSAGEEVLRAPYNFRRDFALDAVASANVGCPLPGDGGDSEVVPPPVNDAPSALDGPIREHFNISAGTGIFAQGTVSDGMANYDEQWLWDNDHFNLQRIRFEEQPTGCDTARYDTDVIGISGTKNMSLTINGETVGEYTIDPNAHGYIFHWPIHFGDQICAVNVGPEGFAIILGPDVYYHYDSYCYRSNC